MKNIITLLQEELSAAFEKAGYEQKYAKVTLSNRPDLCQYQCNGALAAAKQYHKAPIQIANEVVEKLEDSRKARMNAPLSAHDFGYAALQKEAREMAADLLQSEFHITDGEFRLGARISRTERMETSHPMSRPHLEEVKTGKSPETYRRQETPGQKPSDRQRQARHVAPIAPQKKEKKQLIL